MTPDCTFGLCRMSMLHGSHAFPKCKPYVLHSRSRFHISSIHLLHNLIEKRIVDFSTRIVRWLVSTSVQIIWCIGGYVRGQILGGYFRRQILGCYLKRLA